VQSKLRQLTPKSAADMGGALFCGSKRKGQVLLFATIRVQ